MYAFLYITVRGIAAQQLVNNACCILLLKTTCLFIKKRVVFNKRIFSLDVQPAIVAKTNKLIHTTYEDDVIKDNIIGRSYKIE